MTEKTLNQPDTIPSDINEDNLLKKIWLKPTSTLQYILTNCPKKYVTLLLVLGGIVSAIGRASTKNMGDTMSTASVLGITIIVGGLFGWIGYYIFAWAMSATGGWIDGKAEPTLFRTVIAWSLIPTIFSVILLVPELIIFGDDLFRSVPLNESSDYGASWFIFGFLELALGIWSMVILVHGVGLIQNFGIGKSILNMFLPALLIIVPIVAILSIIQMLS